jgi:hypothetical protein
MFDRAKIKAYQLSDPRKIGLLIGLLFIILTLAGCGDIVPACPSGSSGGSSCGIG